MSTERDIAPFIRSWLHDEPDGPADHLLDAVLARIDTAPQRRATWWPPRRTDMNLIVRFGVAAAVVAMTVAIGYSLFQNVGSTDPLPDTPSSVQPAPTAGAGSIPDELAYVWIADPRDVAGLDVDDRLVMVLNDGLFSIALDLGGPVVVSVPTSAEPGVLELETVTGATQCALGDVGRYEYALSPGGTVLTIASASDDCAVREAGVVREWRRSACRNAGNWCLGPMEAGTQSSLFFDPFQRGLGSPDARYGAMTYEVPNGWANALDSSAHYTLMRASQYAEVPGDRVLDCLDCPDGVWILANPSAVRMDCSDDADVGAGTSASSLAEWLRAHPGLVVRDGPQSSIDGRPTIVLDVEAIDSAGACQDPSFDVRHVPLFSHPAYTFGVRVGDQTRLHLVEVSAESAMVVAVDSFDPVALDDVIAETQPIIESITLTAP